MNRVIVILAASLLLQVAGCEGRRPVERAPDAPAPTAAAEKGNAEVKPEIGGARPEDEIALRSARWKAERQVDDFLWLVIHAIPAGTAQSRVEALLGKPLRQSRPLGNEIGWLYLKSTPERPQPDTLSLVFDADGTLVELLAVPDQTQMAPEGKVPVAHMPPETIAEVRQAFRAQAKPIADKLVPMSGRPAPEFLQSLVSLGSRGVVRRQAFSRALARIEDSMTESEREVFVLHGTIDALRRDGECWCVICERAASAGLVGYLDVGTGELLLLRIVPEG